MSGSATGHDDHGIGDRLATAANTDHAPALECVVVRYRERSDRCTFAPRECTEAEQLTQWLSADIDTVVDLDNVR
ncbi:DUF7511 domain-containing protein [Natronorubrum sulfidifaciens]|uniref:DUF7511 domain-containing protein n=1 Tax=Natronorubrum sulfidifaciens JCM 14089 TaxID=1230460 RepID=L9W746_9EURY|nr:hypothetical protein [Natronorubrum sulfidifaciens]ELY45066.1 hypothetical protein C495_08995 [Natronorubrum sulfidifaciens JCM 14089]